MEKRKHPYKLVWTSRIPLATWLAQVLSDAIDQELEEALEAAIDEEIISLDMEEEVAQDYTVEDNTLVIRLFAPEDDGK